LSRSQAQRLPRTENRGSVPELERRGVAQVEATGAIEDVVRRTFPGLTAPLGQSVRWIARSLGRGRDRVRAIVARAEGAGLRQGGASLSREPWRERVAD